jgi:hypothetical protein
MAWWAVLRVPVLIIVWGTSIAVAILAWPMRNARLDSFYVGETALKKTIQSLVITSLE